jgi:hypothetical protein
VSPINTTCSATAERRARADAIPASQRSGRSATVGVEEPSITR